MDYSQLSDTIKTISDPNRLEIIELLSSGGLRACDILEYFDFSQPTLSYHMKVLCSEGLVDKSRDGRWVFYSMNNEKLKELNTALDRVFKQSASKV